MGRVIRGLALGAGVLALSSCSMGSERATSGSATSRSSSHAAPDDVQGQSYAPSPTSQVPVTEQGVLPGTQRVVVDDLEVTFVVPKGWTVLDATTLTQQATLDKIKPLAERQHKTPQQFAGTVTEDSALVAADLSGDLSQGAGSTIVLLKDTTQYMADQGSFENGIKKMGGTPGTFAKSQTPLGEAARMSYRITSSGKTWYGVEVRIPNGINSTSALSIRATSEKAANTYATDLLSSLRRP